MWGGPPEAGGPTSGRTGSAIEPRTRYHTDTTELQWEYLSDAVTSSIVNDANNPDYAKSDGSRHSSIASPRSAGPGPTIRSTTIDDEAPPPPERIGPA